MIQIIVTCHCRKCGSIDIVKNGHDYKGSQKYHCHNCKSWGTLGAHERYSEAEKKRVVRAGLERSSLRGLERIFRIRRQAIVDVEGIQGITPLRAYRRSSEAWGCAGVR